MSKAEIYECLRNLQVVPTQSDLSEERITELVDRNLIKRQRNTNNLWLTTEGMHTKTGAL